MLRKEGRKEVSSKVRKQGSKAHQIGLHGGGVVVSSSQHSLTEGNKVYMCVDMC